MFLKDGEDYTSLLSSPSIVIIPLTINRREDFWRYAA